MNGADERERETVERLGSTPAAPDTRSWYEHMWRTEQETPQRLEDCAKFLATVLGIVLTLLVTLGKTTLEQGRLAGHVGWAAALGLIALVLCLMVAVPWPYRYADCSVASMKAAHRRIVRCKYTILLAAMAVFLVAMIVMVF